MDAYTSSVVENVGFLLELFKWFHFLHSFCLILVALCLCLIALIVNMVGFCLFICFLWVFFFFFCGKFKCTNRIVDQGIATSLKRFKK